MKTFRIMCAALLAAMTLASCQKEQAGKDNGPQQPKTITISLSNVSLPSKSSSTAQLTNASTAQINNFQVFLADADGNFYKGLNADGSEAAHYFEIDPSDPQAALTQVFHYVKPAVSKVYVVANLGEEKSFAKVENLEGHTISIASQQDEHLENLVLFGKDESLEISSQHGNHEVTEVYRADVPIAPLIARIEVVNFTTTFVENSAYKSVTVDKLAFNDYYTSCTLAGEVSSRVNTEITDANAYTYLNGLTGTQWYFDNLDHNPTNALEEPVIMTRTSATEHDITTVFRHHYAYHFFPSASATLGNSEGYPQLVVGVTAEDNQEMDNKHYLATTSFTGDSNFKGFKPGEIYRINFKFATTSMKNQLKCVEVSVSVQPWTIITLTPNL